jgi:hypothetical protein
MNRKLSPAEKKWLAAEVKEQEGHYQGIVKAMNALEETRLQWFREFYERIQWRGFSVHAGTRRKIKPEEIPAISKKKIRVVW